MRIFYRLSSHLNDNAWDPEAKKLWGRTADVGDVTVADRATELCRLSTHIVLHGINIKEQSFEFTAEINVWWQSWNIHNVHQLNVDDNIYIGESEMGEDPAVLRCLDLRKLPIELRKKGIYEKLPINPLQPLS